MYGYRAGARTSWFNLYGVLALILLSLAVYGYRSALFQTSPSLAINQQYDAVHEGLGSDDDQKTIDFGGDTKPDWCYHDEQGIQHCHFADGSWVTNPQHEAHPVLGYVNDEELPAEPNPEPFMPPWATDEAKESNEPAAPDWTWPPTSTEEDIATESPEPSETMLVESPASTSVAPILPTGTLPSAKQFHLDNGTKWTIEYVGDIQFTGDIAAKNVVGDKCRSGKVGPKVIWNCGDMWCDFDCKSFHATVAETCRKAVGFGVVLTAVDTICGFAMGPAMYGTDDLMTINTTGIEHIYNWDFLRPHETDPKPELPYRYWGMDTSNVVAINDTHGVAYAYEIWRGTPEKDHRLGNVVASVTLGDEKPIATRLGPLLTGPESVEMGMLAIMRDGDYVYIYSQGGPSWLTVTRVPANDDVFDAANYESLEYGTETWSPGIPGANTTVYGMVTWNEPGHFGCSVYGSVFYSNYFNKYLIICNIDMHWTNMYTSDTPWGPWSEEYGLLHGWIGYGSMAHPEYSPGGSHKEFYYSQGPNDQFNMFKLTFHYDDV